MDKKVGHEPRRARPEILAISSGKWAINPSSTEKSIVQRLLSDSLCFCTNTFLRISLASITLNVTVSLASTISFLRCSFFSFNSFILYYHVIDLFYIWFVMQFNVAKYHEWLLCHENIEKLLFLCGFYL